MRWLVEVFIQDWKEYEGWGQLTKQTDEDGSRRTGVSKNADDNSLSLSLLCDHCLLFHPAQLVRIEDKLPACTVGSLRARVQVESLVQFFDDVVLSKRDSASLSSLDSPQEQLELVAKQAQEVFRLNDKHMVGRDLGRLELTPTLKYRVRDVLKAA